MSSAGEYESRSQSAGARTRRTASPDVGHQHFAGGSSLGQSGCCRCAFREGAFMTQAATNTWVAVGGGVSGMAASYFLQQQGFDSEIIEKDGALGGRMGTLQLGERWIDCGGEKIGQRGQMLSEFCFSFVAAEL